MELPEIRSGEFKAEQALNKPVVIMADKKAKTLKVTQIKSSHGRLSSHQACLRGLGIRRMHHSVNVSDTPENRGMINKAAYMLKVEEA